jgi:hypothetical protein
MKLENEHNENIHCSSKKGMAASKKALILSMHINNYFSVQPVSPVFLCGRSK